MPLKWPEEEEILNRGVRGMSEAKKMNGNQGCPRLGWHAPDSFGASNCLSASASSIDRTRVQEVQRLSLPIED